MQLIGQLSAGTEYLLTLTMSNNMVDWIYNYIIHIYAYVCVHVYMYSLKIYLCAP